MSIVRSWMRKVFTPYEVKITIKEAKTFLSQTATLCHRIIEPDVVTLAKDVDKTVYSIRVDRMRPDHLSLLLVTNVLGRHIGSGAYHIYRVVLNMVGQDMLEVWYAAQETMQERGYATEREVAKDNRWIKKQIKKAG